MWLTMGNIINNGRSNPNVGLSRLVDFRLPVPIWEIDGLANSTQTKWPTNKI